MFVVIFAPVTNDIFENEMLFYSIEFSLLEFKKNNDLVYFKIGFMKDSFTLQAEDLHKELMSTRKNLEYRFKAFTGELSSGNIHRRNRIPKI